MLTFNGPHSIQAADLRNSLLIIGSVAQALIQSISVELINDKYSGALTLGPMSRPIEVNKGCMLVVELNKKVCMCYNAILSDFNSKQALHIIPAGESVTVRVEFKTIRIF